MPTFERLAAFLRDFNGLTPAQQEAFLRAVVMFVADLREGKGFRKSLRVKKMEGADGIWELTWRPTAGPPSNTAIRSRRATRTSAGAASEPTTFSSARKETHWYLPGPTGVSWQCGARLATGPTSFYASTRRGSQAPGPAGLHGQDQARGRSFPRAGR